MREQLPPMRMHIDFALPLTDHHLQSRGQVSWKQLTSHVRSNNMEELRMLVCVPGALQHGTTHVLRQLSPNFIAQIDVLIQQAAAFKNKTSETNKYCKT